jgi:hypothetical protein
MPGADRGLQMLLNEEEWHMTVKLDEAALNPAFRNRDMGEGATSPQDKF